MRAELRLTPEMASRKLQVLEFVRRYWTDHGGSPSLSEIAAGLGCERTTVRGHVRRLLAEGRLLRDPALTERALRLPPAEMSEIEAMRVLRARGYVFDEEAAAALDPRTISTLAGLPLLDHRPLDGSDGGQDERDSSGSRS